MKKLNFLLLVLIVFPLVVSAQTLDEKLKEIDDYANTVISTWKNSGAGMAIAVVKDDKVVMAKGYGVKKLDSSPSRTYARLFQAVKSHDIEAIKRLMTIKSLEFGRLAAERNNKDPNKIFENGFTATTFSQSLPPIRDERISGNFGAVEVFNEKEEREKIEARKPGVGAGSASANNSDKSRPYSYDERKSYLESSSWNDLPFIFEDGDWKLAIGELFDGTYKSPGKSYSTLEKERLIKNK